MAKEKTVKGRLEGIRRVIPPLVANRADLPHLEVGLTQLSDQVKLAEDAVERQALHTAAKQEASRQFRTAIAEGERVANVLRVALKQHYGIRSEKLAEFGLQPFRGRKTKKTAEPPTTPQTEAGSPATAPPTRP
jgi:hypothetical protein